MKTNLQVAETILAQLGGNRFIAMTGARSFVGSADSLRFRIPRAANGVTLVTVTLDPSDLYRVTFGRVRGVSLVVIAEQAGVYADQLRAIFTSATGLETSL